MRLSKIIRAVHKNAKTAKTVQPIKMAYASYESTKSTIGLGEPPLIIMHGLFGSKNNWNSLSKAMLRQVNPKRKIIAVDARNHGDSPHDNNHNYQALAHDVKKFMEDHSIPKAALLGHSMGGGAMMMSALIHPDLVDRLIIVDKSPTVGSRSLNTQKIIKAMLNITIQKNVPLSQARQMADYDLTKTVSNKRIRNFLLTNLIRKSDGSYSWRLNLPALAKNYSNIGNFPKIENLSYKGPTLFIVGGLSDMVQRQDHPEIRRLFPKVEFKTIEGTGHWLHSEKPEEFVKIVVEFLNKRNIIK